MTIVWLILWMFNGFPDVPITLGPGNHWLVGLVVCLLVDLVAVLTKGRLWI